MTEEFVSIGRMAELNHISIQTLRLYDRMDLLKPAKVNHATGYRYYDIRQNARLDMIAYMKELGMSLSEIRDVLEKEDIARIEEILAKKNEQLHQQMKDLKARHDAVERVIKSIERYRKSPRTGTISLEYFDRRYLMGIPCQENFYDYDILSFERTLTELRAVLWEQNLPQVHTYNTGTSIQKEDYIGQKMIAKDVFIVSDRKFPQVELQSGIMESGMYACIYSDSYDLEIPYAKKLLSYCKHNHYHIAGDYYCEIISEFNVFELAQRNMYLRLQVPVTFDN